jgi:hypothetical protein
MGKNIQFSVPVDKIIPVGEFVRNFKNMNKKIEKDSVNFLFKNNKPDKVIMTFEKYTELIKLVEELETLQCKQEIAISESKDDKQSYEIEEVFNNL